MTSKESLNLLGNIRIKQEPGTSSATTTSTSTSSSSGTPAAINIPGSTSRLKNLISTRDLNSICGNVIVKKENAKKKIAPNIANYQRRKKDESAPVEKQEAAAKPKPSAKDRSRSQSRGRGRGKSNIVSLGTTTEAPTLTERRWASGGGRGGGSGEKEARAPIDKPVLDLTRVVDKEADEGILKSLYRDDFIDDGDDVIEGDSPISLPVRVDIQEIKSEANKTTKPDDLDDVNEQSTLLENGEAVQHPKKVNKKKPESKLSTNVKAEQFTSPGIVFETNNGQPADYMLVVLPDSLPGFRPEDDSPPKSDPSSSKEVNGEKANSAVNDTDQYCTLNSLNEGLLGKIQIHKSGKAYLKLGHNNLVVELGSHCSFRQDLIAARLDEDKKDLIHLGSISNTLICSPDWETMIANL